MSISEIIKRLQEDRRIAERERRQARIEAAFAQVRTIDRRRYQRPGEVDPALFGRRKDDPPPKPAKSRPALSCLAKPILEDAVNAAPLVYHRRPDVVVHDLGDEPVVEDVPRLFDAALRALGYQPENPPDVPSVSAETEKPSIWKRDIFRMGKGA
jgi:hypothetical protein